MSWRHDCETFYSHPFIRLACKIAAEKGLTFDHLAARTAICPGRSPGISEGRRNRGSMTSSRSRRRSTSVRSGSLARFSLRETPCAPHT